jgi:uncharacterized protein YjbJ (UPF0337 family)
MSNPSIDKAKGEIKETIGKVTGDKQMEAEGQIEQAGATVREKVAEVTGGVADAVVDGIGSVATGIKDKITGKG